MNRWLAFRRLLPLLAALSLALTPLAAPAATAGMHASMALGHHATSTGDRGMARMSHAHMDPTAIDHHDAGSVVTTGLGAGGSDMDDMPCCPKADPARPDCAKGCPLMALCLASTASLLPDSIAIPLPVATGSRPAWLGTTSFASVHGSPLPEPPRT